MGGPVRREAGTYPGARHTAVEGRMGGRAHQRPALQGASLLCLAGSLLLAPPPVVGRGRRGGDLLSIHLDHALATRARRDGQRVRVKPEHLFEGLRGVGDKVSAEEKRQESGRPSTPKVSAFPPPPPASAHRQGFGRWPGRQARAGMQGSAVWRCRRHRAEGLLPRTVSAGAGALGQPLRRRTSSQSGGCAGRGSWRRPCPESA